MGLWIAMPTSKRFDISGFVTRKYRERVAATPADRPLPSMSEFAREIGVSAQLLNNIASRKGAERITLEVLQKFVAYFGKEFTDEFGLTPPAKPKGVSRTG